MKKRTYVIIFIVIAFIIALSYALAYVVYDRYGFLFELNGSQEYFISIGRYKKSTDGIDMEVDEDLSKIDKASFYSALKEASYTPSNVSLSEGEMVYVIIGDTPADEACRIAIIFEYSSEKLYLVWNHHQYEITNFKSARAIIAENLPCYAITGYKNWEENTFVTMPYFTSYSKNDSYRNSGFVNVSPEALTDNDSIIAHASKEVPEGYNASALYTERFGDGYMVVFSYKSEDYSVGEYIFVIMSNDGVTECMSYRPYMI